MNRGEPILVLEIKSSKLSTLTLYQSGEGGYPSTSSENDYPFFLSTWNGDKITEVFEEEEEEI